MIVQTSKFSYFVSFAFVAESNLTIFGLDSDSLSRSIFEARIVFIIERPIILIVRTLSPHRAKL